MFDFIEKVIYINLEHRNDRKDQIEKQLSIFPSKKVERFNAIYEINRGHLGCSKSHIEVLKLAIQNNWKNYLVVEDDAEFCNFETGYKVLENLVSNPYDVIVLGGTALSCDTSSYKLYNCCCTTAYMVSNHYYSRLLKNFEEGAFFLDKNYNQSELYAIDQHWHSLQRIDNWYCVFPVLFKQISD
jgi:glycosyl transferase family 25